LPILWTMSTATLLHQLFKQKAWINRETFDQMLKFDPVAQQAARHSAVRVLNHVYVVDRIWAAQLTGAKHPYEATNTAETPTLEDLRDAVFASDAWYVAYTASLSSAQLAERIAFTFTDGDKGRMSREEILAHVATHGSYHRGAAGRVMVQSSITPPPDSLTTFLHKFEPGRRETS
jgi:uncharacterized damage-inducible protein DinB